MSEGARDPAIGVRWDPRWPPERLEEVARTVERLGYDELWLVEDCFSGGGLTMAAAALAWTERIVVGVGVLPALVRNAAIATMEIASLARMFPGRFVASFGHGVDDWMRQIDARPADRLGALEETVRAVRELLAGRAETVDGAHVRLRGVQLEHPPEIVPDVLIGTTGPRGLALAGRCADGVVVPEVAGPEAVRWVRSCTAAAGGPGRTVVYAYLSIDDTSAAGLDVARPLVEHWLRNSVFPDLAERAGLGRDGSGEFAEEALRGMAVAGDASDCASTVRGLWDAGADSVVLLPRSPGELEQVERFAREALPLAR